jgi:lipopolysaccharide transport system permease protein
MSTTHVTSSLLAVRSRLTTSFIDELWRYRELLYFFAWRDVKVRYRQAFLGAAWAVIQPLFNMVIFAVVFGRLAHVPSNGIPYPLFSYCALVPWTYFSSVVGLASGALTNNSGLITKVYFPRVLLPLATTLAGLLDFVIASVLLVAMMLYYHITPSWRLLLIPGVVLFMVLLTAGISMIVAAVSVRYRDVKYVLPFLIQIWLFATPVIYPSSIVPQRLRFLLALNPCWAVVDGFRACLFPGQPIDFKLLSISIGVSFGIFAAAVYYFRKSEREFADII